MERINETIYQSAYTGKQIDLVIKTVNENWEAFQDLSSNMNRIENLEEALGNTGIQGGLIDKVQQLERLLCDNTYQFNPTQTYNFLPISGGTMKSTAQIVGTRDGGSFSNAPNTALIKFNQPMNGYNGFVPLYNYSINKGNMTCGINYGTENSIEWRLVQPGGNSGVEDYLAKITDTGALLGACWNDYAEFRQTDEIEPGRVVCENGDGTLSKSTQRLQPGAEIVSDTYGFAIGETKECKTPIAMTGRVLAYPYENKEEYKPGDAVCAGPGGTVSKMTREEIINYPERIIGTVSEIPSYGEWGKHHTKVNGRIWIRVK